MIVHHLNCATLCPPLGRLLNAARRLVCHCLLIEADAGLVLIDTGLGMADIADPRRRLGRTFAWTSRPLLDREEAAASQIQRLGFSAGDVRHIVPTHLDLDHVGGLSDFPLATVHVHGPELDAALTRSTYYERQRYRPIQLQSARWQPHPSGGETFYGFQAVRPIPGLPEILLVPLAGHTRGHAGVAVHTREGWVFHCGDAYFHASEMTAQAKGTPYLDLVQRLDDMDRVARKKNQERLRELALAHPRDVRLFCSHDPSEFEAFLA